VQELGGSYEEDLKRDGDRDEPCKCGRTVTHDPSGAARYCLCISQNTAPPQTAYPMAAGNLAPAVDAAPGHYRTLLGDKFSKVPDLVSRSLVLRVASADLNKAWLETHGKDLNFVECGVEGRINDKTERYATKDHDKYASLTFSKAGMFPLQKSQRCGEKPGMCYVAESSKNVNVSYSQCSK
jgi:hypothetical protein